jgi:DNA replication protein DnaC
MTSQAILKKQVNASLKELRLAGVRDILDDIIHSAQKNGWTLIQLLHELFQAECQNRRSNRVGKLLRESKLPLEKNRESFDHKRLPLALQQKAQVLYDGLFVERKENVLAFGLPGSGKTHLLCAIAQEQIRKGKRAIFYPCSILVQELLRAKKDLQLDKALKKLGKYDVVCIDDIGYVQQSREEMEVLFTLLAQRYERGSVMLTSNLPFSKWESIFKDPMTTAAAIDRLVHHSVILELNVPSYRTQAAKSRKKGGETS